MVLCFRLHFTKDSTTINTAGATVRQLVSLVFERVIAEDDQTPTQETQEKNNLEELKVPTNQAPKGLEPCAADAYLMFQVKLKRELINKNFYYINFNFFINEQNDTYALKVHLVVYI